MTINKWGTIFFEIPEMQRLIGFGDAIMDGLFFKGFTNDASVLNIAPWLAFVPECYRSQCEAIAKNVAADFTNERIRDDTLRTYILRLRSRIEAEVEPV